MSSAEVVKKRGRPKKVISDLVEVELLEASKKVTTRSKSTKAAPRAAKASPIAAKPATVKPITTNIASTKSKPSPPPPAAKPPTQRPATPAQKSTQTPAPASKISEQVRELSAKNGNEGFPKKAEAPAKGTISAVATSSTPSSPPSAASTASPPSPTKPASKPRIPLAEMNSEIVSRISTRAGARPNTAGSKQLPPNYKSVARRLTMVVVAIPVALVTSYVLYQRLDMEDPLNLMRPRAFKVEDSGTEEKKPETPNST